MSTQCENTGRDASGGTLSRFERYLSLWVILSIVAGIVLGKLGPHAVASLAALEVAQVNLPVAALIWVMIVPMLARVDFSALQEVRRHGRGIAVTLTVNWLVKPFSMAVFAWLFIRHIFAPLLPAGQIDSYIAGLILLAAAPCTAMVFVWSRLSGGDALFTLSQVALNDTIMVFAFTPIVALLLGLSSISVPWATLATSVLIYLLMPLAIGQGARRILIAGGPARFDAAMHALARPSMAALLATLMLLVAFQGTQILAQPLVIVLLAVPILAQVVLNATLAYLANRALGESHSIACPSALIGASNFFELAVATAIGLFGLNSGAALATVVGVLIEVPIMLAVVQVVTRTRRWYEAGRGSSRTQDT